MKNALQIIQINLFVSSYFISFHPLLNGVQWVKKITQVKNTSLTEVFFFIYLLLETSLHMKKLVTVRINCFFKMVSVCCYIPQKENCIHSASYRNEFVILIFKDIHHSSRIVFSRPDVNVRNMPVRCISEKKN